MGLRYAVLALGCLACRTAGHGILVSPPPRVGTSGPNNQGNKLTGDAGNANCGGTENGDTAYALPKNNPKVAQKPGDIVVVSWSVTIPHPADNLNRGVRIALHYGDGDSFNNNVLKEFGQVDASDESILVQIPEEKTCNNCVLQWLWDAVDDGGHYVQCVDMAITADGLLPDPPLLTATDNNNNGLPDGGSSGGGGAEDVVNIDITSDKSTAGKEIVTWALPTTVAALWAGVGQVINPSNVAVSETSTGYKAEVTPPTGTTAKELKDMLPGAAGDVLKNTLNSAYTDMQLTAVTICVAASGAACAMPPPTPPPPPLPPGATTEMVSAKEVTLVLKAVGTVEEYEAKAESVKESLRWELYCFLPTCTLTDTVESNVEASNGVILTVVATDTAVVVTDTGTRSEVETSAVLWQAKTLDAMSSVLDLTIEDSDIEAVAVQLQVTRLAPSPPPTSPDICTVQDCERNLAEGRAEYQQAVAAGRKKEQDGMCVFGGMLFAAISGSECTGPDCFWTMSHDYTDCNCGIDTASFAETSDCPDFLARLEREVCDKLRACAGLPPRDSGSGDSGPGLAIGLALGGCLLVAMLGAAVFVWHRKRRTQPPQSGAPTAAPQQVEVTVTQPESKKAAAPESLPALLAACGLEHHEETFKAEGYTLETLLSSMAQGEEAVKGDLRELKLTLGECRKLIYHLRANK